jgi:hypothetical protein
VCERRRRSRHRRCLGDAVGVLIFMVIGWPPPALEWENNAQEAVLQIALLAHTVLGAGQLALIG